MFPRQNHPLLDQCILHPREIETIGTGAFLRDRINQMDRGRHRAVRAELLVCIGLGAQPAHDLVGLILSEDAHL